MDELKIHICVPQVETYHDVVNEVSKNITIDSKTKSVITQSLFSNIQDNNPDLVLFHVPNNGTWENSGGIYRMNRVINDVFDEINSAYKLNIPIFYTYPYVNSYYRVVRVDASDRIYLRKIEIDDFRKEITKIKEYFLNSKARIGRFKTINYQHNLLLLLI